MIIRKAIINDAKEIAKVHVDTWKSAYKDIICNEYLERLSYENREKSWKSMLDNDMGLRIIYVAEEENETIVGFISGGYEKKDTEIKNAEIYGFYVLKDYQNNGIGKMLFKKILESFNKLNLQSVSLWALNDNYGGRKFYESNGGIKVNEKEITIGNEKLKEIQYLFKNIKDIINIF
ncbi:GNAT family N-acetyltransferase [Clostridium ihumii]|uniref:GNAT family N-acetyltransferase n=1 Tax=Clostridium ihumii TaxID=1470356 RepID=UPI00055633E0|nr:GNAT family N-acetyltransferase [Clostridium ihumii]